MLIKSPIILYEKHNPQEPAVNQSQSEVESNKFIGNGKKVISNKYQEIAGNEFFASP